MVGKKEIITLLESIADILEFKGENPFKVSAYRAGAAAIRKLDDDLIDIIHKKDLSRIKGIGKGLQAIIYEFSEKGTSEYLNEISTGIPKGIKELMKIKGLGPKKISTLYEQLNISDIDELEQAAVGNKIASLKGFSYTIQEMIIKEIERIRDNSGLVLLDHALEIGEEIKNKIESFSSVDEVLLSGLLKRKREVVDLIDIIVITELKEEFESELRNYLAFNKNGNEYTIKDIYPVTIKIMVTDRLNSVLLDFFTSADKEYLSKLPQIKLKTYKDDISIYKDNNIAYVIPEMREIEYYDYHQPDNSDLELKGLNALLHFHTNYSDGRNTLEEMLTGSIQRYYKFAAVCDHSKSAYYANGLNEERILLQFNEIERIGKKLNTIILRGIESDILQDGSLDYSDEVLEEFEFVVASVHSRFKATEEEMTRRIIKAVENPHTNIIGHISGRLLLSREPYKFKIDKVLDACARNNVAVEINSNPRRLDIDWRYLYKARDMGCLFTINADAHSVAELDLVKYGIMMGRKAGLKKDEVINYYNYKKFINFLSVKLNKTRDHKINN